MSASQALYDMIVLGGGPGGYTAAMYGARAGLNTLVLEKLSAGGQMALTSQIDNYPGFPEGIDGYDLGQKMLEGAERFGAKTEIAEVESLDLNADPKEIYTSEGVFYAKSVVIAMGASPKKLGIAGEEELTGKGVHYCAHCDGMFYKGKTAVVIGGGNSAAADALLLSRICKEVIIVHRRDALRATKIYHDPLMKATNISFRWNSVVTDFIREDKITGVRVMNTVTGKENEILCSGVFISVGRKPATEIMNDQLALDKNGYIVADESTETSIPGVFAVGDIRTKVLRQIVTAVSDGAMAAHHAESFLTENS